MNQITYDLNHCKLLLEQVRTNLLTHEDYLLYGIELDSMDSIKNIIERIDSIQDHRIENIEGKVGHVHG